MKIYKNFMKIFRKYRDSKMGYINIEYENAKRILKNDKKAILIDVRSKQEYLENHLNGSINIPLYNIEKEVEEIIPDKTNTVIVYCQSGGRSKSACQILIKKEYINVYNIEGGLDAI